MVENNLRHLAIIMDGNARWAKKNGKTKAQGHRQGAENIKTLLPAIPKLGIEYLTLYAFSSENWQRPKSEVLLLLELLKHYIDSTQEQLIEHNIKLKIVGNLEKLPSSLVSKINSIVDLTKNNSKMTLAIAFSYGSRSEIVDACQKAIDSGSKTINQEEFKNFLYDPKMPDVDLLIRTSGVYRISNFLLWQAAYAELYFSDKLWPDFDENDIKEAVQNYSQRKRTFGVR